MESEMAESWQVDGPRILEVGGEQEPLRELRVGLVAGRVDVVAHPPGAEDAGGRLEVTDVQGRPLEVTWDGGVLSVQHPKVTWDGLLESIKAMARRDDRAEISVAVP